MRAMLGRLIWGQGGLILAALISLLLGTAAVLGIIGYAVKGSQEYNRFHQLAQEAAADPNSHTEEEILNAGDALVEMMSETVQAGASGSPGGAGVQLLLQAEDALRRVRNQQFVIKIAISPANPAPFQTVSVTVTVLNSVTGTAVNYQVAGSDGFGTSGTLQTNQAGQIVFSIPGGAAGVIDVITITVGAVSETFQYAF